MSQNLLKAIEETVKETQRMIEKINLRHELSGLLKEAGFELNDEYYKLRYGLSLTVTPKQLPALRKIVGRFDKPSKSLTCDHDTTNDIWVQLYPKEGKFKGLLSIRYKTKLRGTKCRVEQRTDTYKTLVCKV